MFEIESGLRVLRQLTIDWSGPLLYLMGHVCEDEPVRAPAAQPNYPVAHWDAFSDDENAAKSNTAAVASSSDDEDHEDGHDSDDWFIYRIFISWVEYFYKQVKNRLRGIIMGFERFLKLFDRYFVLGWEVIHRKYLAER